jgi:hypothetical protein
MHAAKSCCHVSQEWPRSRHQAFHHKRKEMQNGLRNPLNRVAISAAKAKNLIKKDRNQF